MPPYCRLCDITAQIKYAKPNYKGFLRIILLQIFYNILNVVTCNHFAQNKPVVWDETNFNLYETSFIIQNGSAQSTNVKIINCL